jgi:hypothetical protein
MAPGGEEGPCQRAGHRRLGDRSHRDRSEGSSQLRGPGEGFGAGFVDLNALEAECSHQVAQKIGWPPPRLDQADRPAGVRELQDEPRCPSPAADIQERRGRGGEDGEEEQGVQDEVLEAIALGPVPRQTADFTPAPELVQIHAGARLESAIDRRPKGRDARFEPLPRIFHQRTALWPVHAGPRR